MTINLEKSIDVTAPVQDVYQVWLQFAQFPDFMGNVHDVDITDQVENSTISWQTRKGPTSTAQVRFVPGDDGQTTVTFSAHYPNGVGTDTTTQALSQQIEDDLNRFAKLLDGQPASSLQKGRVPSAFTTDDTADADVLGPAYSFQAPATAAANNPLVQTLQESLSTAANAWLTTMLQAFNAPFQQMRVLTEQFDQNFSGLIRGMDVPLPKLDLSRDGNTLKVTAKLPGATSDDVQVEIRNGKLLVSSDYHVSTPDGEGGSSHHFFESLDLMDRVDSSSVDARIDEQGLLEITLKLQEETQAQQRETTEA